MKAIPTHGPRPVVTGIAVGLLVVAAVVAIVAWRGLSDNDAPQKGGGGGEPPASMRVVNDSLPKPEGLTLDQELVSSGQDAFVLYWAKQKAEDVIAFYTSKMPASGWKADGTRPVDVPDDPAKGGFTQAFTATFVKDEFSVTILAGDTSKAPERGASHVEITIRPLKQ